TGGMYPVIDMTAGEKERRTLEVLLASPAGRNEIVLGKLLATTAIIFLTALLAISSLLYSLRLSPFARLSPETKEMFSQTSIDASTLALVLIVLAPTTVMAGSIMLAVAIFARGFKEAQSYLTPMMLLVIVPAIASMVPGNELSTARALIPIL